jgi:hypothetical protein
LIIAGVAAAALVLLLIFIPLPGEDKTMTDPGGGSLNPGANGDPDPGTPEGPSTFIPGESGFSSSDPAIKMIEVNQGLSYGYDTGTGEFYLMDNFVAGKETAVFIDLERPPDPKADVKLTVERNGALVCVMSEFDYIDDSTLLFQPEDMAEAGFWQPGFYSFTFEMGGSTAVRTTTLYESMPLKILAVPLMANYDGRIASCTGAWENGAQMLIDTYPVAKADVEYVLGPEIDVSAQEYDLVQNYFDSWFAVGNVLTELQTPENDYTMILGFMPEPIFYGNGDRTSGYSHNQLVSVIGENQPEMLMAVCHEIAHGYYVGDEYPNGFFNPVVNCPPYKLSGRNLLDQNQTIEGTNENVVSGEEYGLIGPGSVIYAEQRAYCVSDKRLLGAVTSFMGNARDLDPYTRWISSEIWNHLFTIFTGQEAKGSS